MPTPERDTFLGILWIFFKLGCTSFGGPVAHIGFFRTEFVERRQWIGDRDYADLVALAQFLPGPASSQVGMGLGLLRGGVVGMTAAWLGFTLPSAVLMAAFALGFDQAGLLDKASWIIGVKAAVVAIVAQALVGMARSLAPDAPRTTLAVAAMAVALLLPGAWAQVATIALAAVIGFVVPNFPGANAPKADPKLKISVSKPMALLCLTVFFTLLIALPLALKAINNDSLDLFDAFYRAGALVFGGGHVVLPLLQGELVEPGLVAKDTFIAGYAGAQIIPGPMFTIATHLGALAEVGPGGLAGAALATIAIFLPSALLMLGAMPYWTTLSTNQSARGALTAVAAAVVGLLGAAFFDPVMKEGLGDAIGFIFAAAVYVCLSFWKLPVWAVVPAAGLLSAILF